MYVATVEFQELDELGHLSQVLADGLLKGILAELERAEMISLSQIPIGAERPTLDLQIGPTGILKLRLQWNTVVPISMSLYKE